MPFGLTTGSALRRRINALDPIHDDEEIARLSNLVLYGDAYFSHSTFLVTFARQAAVPAIARVLYRSGQGDVIVDPRRRNDDTILFFTEFYRRGYRSVEGRAAIARMEKIHSNFVMDDETKAYTMATVIFEPQRLAAKFGCKPFSTVELEGLWNFWRGFAAAMPLSLPADTRDGFLAWMTDFERRNYAFTPDGAAIFDALVEDWRRWYPNWIGGAKVARESLIALLDDHLRETFELPRTSRSMALRAWLTSNAYLRSTPVRVMRENRSIARRFGRRHTDPRNLDDVGYKPRTHRARGKTKPAA